MEIETYERWQRSITSDFKAALKKSGSEKDVASRVAAVLEDRLAVLTRRADALEQEKRLQLSRLDDEIAGTKEEMTRIKAELKAAKKGPPAPR